MNALEVFRKALRELSERHAQELPRKLAEIDGAWDAAVRSAGAREDLVAVQRLAHALDVASSMLGLPALSSPSRRISRELSILTASPMPLTTLDVERVNDLMEKLRLAAGEITRVGGLPEPDSPAPADGSPGATDDPPLLPSPAFELPMERPPRLSVVASPAPAAVLAPEPDPFEQHRPSSQTASPAFPLPEVEAESRRLLYILDGDELSQSSLTNQISRFGYDARPLRTRAELRSAVERQQPYALLIDVDAAAEDLPVTAALAALGPEVLARIPFICLSEHADMQTRLESVRAGAAAYFLKPARVADIVDKLDALAMREAPEPYRVMILDADLDRSDLCRVILHEVGMDVSVVNDPAELVPTLGEFNPEILLIALKLPGCGGDEVAQVVHQIPSYVSLPVVFLSEHWNLDRQIGLMNVGGDALLPLPLQASQLIATVIARVERYRTLSGLMQHDSLTGLLNHSRLQQYLEIESLRAMRQAHPLSFAMIDLDHFKSINDQFGHPVGDRVLKNLSRFLRKQLRKSDIVGRYGGEEFAIVLTDTDGPAALSVVEKLCSDFSRIEHEVDGAALTVTFSAGVASMQGRSSSRDLVLAADRALYVAKRSGRNRVVFTDCD
jgi:diguanylate cyclase (GGDEF)-like protein